MIEGHGDDSCKYLHPIRDNFSSDVYNKVNLDELRMHLCRRISTISACPEPEPYTLEARLADRHALPAASVCVTSGATEAIYLIARTFRGTNTAILTPIFSEYADTCHMHRHRVTSLYTLEAVPENVCMVWLCNPSDPAGEVHGKERLTELIRKHPQVYFVVDQSYEYFTLEELLAIREATGSPNVVLSHSMTKRYAIPRLRLGYVAAQPRLMAHLRTNRMPWSVNQLAIEAGLCLPSEGIPEALSMEDHLTECVHLKSSFEAIGGLKIWPTDTHFVLACLRLGKAAALKEYLAREEGILIHDTSNFEGLDECFFRTATQTPEESDELMRIIAKWMAG